MPRDTLTGDKDVLGLAGAVREIGYAEITSDITAIASTSYIDVAGLTALTFTVTDRPVVVTFYTPQVLNGTAGQNVTIGLALADNTVQGEATFASGTAFQASPLAVERRYSTPGTYTVKARVKVSGGGGKIGAAPPLVPTLIKAIVQ